MLKKTLPRAIALLACVLMGAGTTRAAGPRDSLMVSATWLAEHLKDSNLVILTVGEAPTYKAEHIPGARYITVDDLAAPRPAVMTPTTLALEMPDEARMREQLQKFGISDNSKIVVYYSNQWYSPSTRTIFALNFAGLGAQTVLLEGGLRAWKAAGHPTTTDVPAVVPGRLSPLKLRTDLIVDATFVQTTARTPGFALVDGRDAASYEGIAPPPPPANAPPRPPQPIGHIPGATVVSFSSLFNEREELRPAEELQALFTKAGVKPGDKVVGYCWVGQITTAMLFAARTLGHDVKLYDGSIGDWSTRQLPLETGKKGGGDR